MKVRLGVGLLSRWRLSVVRKHPLPSPARPATCALEAVVEHPEGAIRLLTCCLEWERELGHVRAAQTRALRELLHVRGGDLAGSLVLADLNAPPTAAEVRTLTDHCVDAWAAANDESSDGRTFCSENPYTSGATWQLDGRIDYVLMHEPALTAADASRWCVEAATVAREAHHQVQPSDHYPVVADIRVTAGNG